MRLNGQSVNNVTISPIRNDPVTLTTISPRKACPDRISIADPTRYRARTPPPPARSARTSSAGAHAGLKHSAISFSVIAPSLIRRQ
jgi:hypothetical protein